MADVDIGIPLGGGGTGSATAASAATAAIAIRQATNQASVDQGYQIAEVQEAWPELVALLDIGTVVNQSTITASFNDAADALTVASSEELRDLINAGGYVDQLGRVSTELFQYYGGYSYTNLEGVRNTDGDPTLGGIFAVDCIFNSTKTAIYYSSANSVISKRVLSEAGNVLTAGPATDLDITALYGGTTILGFDVAPDESRLIVIDNNTDDIYEVVLTTPGDLSTATVGSNQSVSNVPRALCYNRDGTAVWYYDTQNNRFGRWPLSTAYDFSTRGSLEVTPTGTSHPTAGSYNGLRKLYVNDDETEYFLGFSGGSNIYRHERLGANPWNINPTPAETISLPGTINSATGFWFEYADFRQLWVTDGDVYQYMIPPDELQAP